MTRYVSGKTTTTAPSTHRLSLLLSATLLAQPLVSSLAEERPPKADRYRQVNLVSDLAGHAVLQDTNLVNSWGIAFSGGSPFWISDNGTGKATLYAVTNDTLGAVTVTKQGLEVSIPGEGNPTGQLFNGTPAFHGDVFIFASEDGTISGWRQPLGTNAETLVRRTNSVYKGIALATNLTGTVLLA